VIAGLPTSIPLLQAIIKDPGFVDGDYHIDWLAGFLRGWQPGS
jgi:acetyl-CoA carboxylase biotin carboxylase subunit